MGAWEGGACHRDSGVGSAITVTVRNDVAGVVNGTLACVEWVISGQGVLGFSI